MLALAMFAAGCGSNRNDQPAPEAAPQQAGEPTKTADVVVPAQTGDVIAESSMGRIVHDSLDVTGLAASIAIYAKAEAILDLGKRLGKWFESFGDLENAKRFREDSGKLQDARRKYEAAERELRLTRQSKVGMTPEGIQGVNEKLPPLQAAFEQADKELREVSTKIFENVKGRLSNWMKSAGSATLKIAGSKFAVRGIRAVGLVGGVLCIYDLAETEFQITSHIVDGSKYMIRVINPDKTESTETVSK
jgi:hypothetical protein